MNEGGACPDFVALDFSCHDVVVIEVTAAIDWHPLARRVDDRQARWFSPISIRLMDQNMIDANWRIRFLGFVRQEVKEAISRRFAGVNEVTFYPLEDAVILWRSWTDRMNNGLPGNRRKALTAPA
jgi:hypothetical protein